MQIIEDGSQLTPEWFSVALGRPVIAVQARPIGTGQMGASWRVVLDYAGEPGPSPLVVKLAAGDEAARATSAHGYRKEIGFYTELAPTLAVRTPTCWYAAITDDGANFTLLLEDLAPAVPGAQANSCSLANATGAVRNLAALHAPRWNDESLRSHEFLSPLDEVVAELYGAAYQAAAPQFVDRYAEVLASEDAATIGDCADLIVAWLLDRPAPFAVTHGDYRLDNLMFSPDAANVAALDWQTVSVGPPGRDLAYFVGTTFDAATRREYEGRLVGEYHERLVDLGVEDYPLEQCREDYRAGQLQGPLITVLGAIYATAERSASADRMFLTMATRSCAAIRDLRSIELIAR